MSDLTLRLRDLPARGAVSFGTQREGNDVRGDARTGGVGTCGLKAPTVLEVDLIDGGLSDLGGEAGDREALMMAGGAVRARRTGRDRNSPLSASEHQGQAQHIDARATDSGIGRLFVDCVIQVRGTICGDAH